MKAYESKSLQKERQRLTQVNDKDFVSRNYFVKMAAKWILYPIVAVWSAFTAGSYLYTNFERTFNSVAIALAATILIAIMIEVGKYFFGTSAIDDIYDGALSENINSRVAFVLKLIAASAFFYFSITASLNGGKTSAEYYKQQTAPPELVSLDAIKGEYDSYIEDQKRSIKNAENMTWKGVIVRKGQDIIKQANNEIGRLNIERSEKLAAANNENENILKEWQIETKKTGVWFTGLAGLGEILALIILIFCVNYENGGSSVFVQVDEGFQKSGGKFHVVSRGADKHLTTADNGGKITRQHYRKSPADNLLTNELSEADNVELTTADNGAADNVQPLSDKGRQKIGNELSAIEIISTDNGEIVKLSGPIFDTVRKDTFNLSVAKDFEKFKASARQSYHRQFISGEPSTRITHKARWDEMQKVLDHYGIEYWLKGDDKITYDYKQSNEFLENNK